MPQFWMAVLSLVGLLVASTFASPAASERHNVKRAPQVTLLSQSYSNDVLSGSINVSY